MKLELVAEEVDNIFETARIIFLLFSGIICRVRMRLDTVDKLLGLFFMMNHHTLC